MSTIINVLEDLETTPAGTVPTEDSGFGALATEKGNLPLEAIDVQLSTTGLALETELTQGFRNPYSEPLEATYVFPLPPRAAVTALRMEADDRVIEGVLKEREQARTDYDQAISEGKRASIAEEERPGVFTMRVGNILPGEHVKVSLTLAGQLAYEDGEATLRFPLVVAPRYIPGDALGDGAVGGGVVPDTDAVPDASRITPPVLLPGCPNPVALSIEVDIDPAGLPLADVASSLHPISTADSEGGRVRVEVHPGQRADRDFVLRLRLGEPDAVTSSLVVVPDAEGDEGTFGLTLLPPVRAVAGKPRDVVFVLDRSGSMAGWKMVAARRAAARIVDTLGSRDRFAVLAFDNVIETPPDLGDGLVDATDRHRFRAVEHLARMDARGGTEMLSPLSRGAELLTADIDAERERVLILVTDGQVGNEDQILRELGPRLAGVRVHTVGIDVAVNEAFLQRLAAAGGGHTELVESEDRLDIAMEAIHRRVGTPVLTDVQLAPESLDVIGASVAPAVLPALYSGAALTVTGRYRGAAKGSIRVIGRSAGSPRAERIAARVGDNPALTAVWARARLRDLEDRYVTLEVDHFGDSGASLNDLEKQIVATSLRFGVLCRFTAYVAIDSRVVTDGSGPRQVTQPVDLPQGWEMAPPPGALGGYGGMQAAMGAPSGAPMGASFRSQAMASGPMMPRAMAPGRARWAHRAKRESAPVSPAQQAISTTARELLTELEAADPAEHGRLLLELRSRIGLLVVELERGGATINELNLIRELETQLETYAQGDAEALETESLWQRTLDVLRTITSGDPSAPAQPRQSRRSFWRR